MYGSCAVSLCAVALCAAKAGGAKGGSRPRDPGPPAPGPVPPEVFSRAAALLARVSSDPQAVLALREVGVGSRLGVCTPSKFWAFCGCSAAAVSQWCLPQNCSAPRYPLAFP